jgi:hypothetical protein
MAPQQRRAASSVSDSGTIAAEDESMFSVEAHPLMKMSLGVASDATNVVGSLPELAYALSQPGRSSVHRDSLPPAGRCAALRKTM